MIFCCKIIKFVHVAQWIERSPPERKAVGSTPIMYIHFRGCRTKKLVRCPFFYVNVVYNLKNKSQASKTLGFMVKY